MRSSTKQTINIRTCFITLIDDKVLCISSENICGGMIENVYKRWNGMTKRCTHDGVRNAADSEADEEGVLLVTWLSVRERSRSRRRGGGGSGSGSGSGRRKEGEKE